MDAESRHRVKDIYEWALRSPAHYTEVEKAVAVARSERQQAEKLRKDPGDIHISAHDDEVRIWFEAERPKNPVRRGAAAEIRRNLTDAFEEAADAQDL